MIGKGGELYGTTVAGGSADDGTLFSLTPPSAPGNSWTETLLHQFTCLNDGGWPYADVAIGENGVLYGTTNAGGTSGSCTVYSPGTGTAFSLTPPPSPGGPWTEAVLYNFTGGSDGGNPYGGVAIGENGVLYGTTYTGGSSNLGTLFALKPPGSPGEAWTETVLHNFTGNDGATPQAGLIIQNGVLYGTTMFGGTSGHGTLFSLSPPISAGSPWTETVLHNFTGGRDGASPFGPLVTGANGVFYGTTHAGGAAHVGTVFALKP